MNNLVIPPSPNWYESKILACAIDNTVIYGSKCELVIIKPEPYDKPANIKIISHAHYERVTSVDINSNWSPNNKLAASAGEDKVVKLWDIENYTTKSINTTHTAYSEKLVGAVFAGNEKIVGVTENGFISVWRISTDEVTPLKNIFGFKVQITAISMCPHSSWLTAFGLKCGLVIIADLRKNGKILYKMRGHDKPVVSLSWCPAPWNIFPQNTIRKLTSNTDCKNEDIKHAEDITAEISSSEGTEIKSEVPSDRINGDESEMQIAEIASNKLSDAETATNITELAELKSEVFPDKVDEDEKELDIAATTSINLSNTENVMNAGIDHLTPDNSKQCLDNTAVIENDPDEINVIEANTEVNTEVNSEHAVDPKADVDIIQKSQKDDLQANENASASVNTKVLDENTNSNINNVEVIESGTKDICNSKVEDQTTEDDLKGEITDLSELRKEYLLASSAKGGSIYIWRAGTDGRRQLELHLSSKNKRRYRGFEKSWITLCWITPYILLSSSAYGELLQWDLSKTNKEVNGPQKKVIHHDHGSNLFAIAAPIQLCNRLEQDNWRNRTESFAWTFGQERFLLYTSLQADRTTHVSYPTNGGYIYSLASSLLDPNRLAVGIGDNTAKIWDLSRPHLQCIVMTNLWQKIQSKVLTLAWHPTKEAVLAYATFEGRIGLINTNNSSKTPTLLNQHFRAAVHKIVWGPLDGNIDVIGLYACGEGQLAIYNTDKPTNEPKIMQIGTKEHVTCMAWKSDYSLLSVGTKMGSIFIYDINLKLITTIYGQHKSILTMLWHPEATAEDTETSLYNSWIAVSTVDASILIYDLAKEKGDGDNDKSDSRLLTVLNGHSKPVRCLCWSSYEGGKLVSGGDDGVAQVWDVKSEKIISTFTGHNVEAILTVLWSPLDKKFIITGGKDNCIRIWNINENKPMTETELAEVWKEHSKLRQGFKKYKQAEESDDEKEKVKIHRGVMLNLTSRSHNKPATVLEDCKRLVSMLDNEEHRNAIEPAADNNFDLLKLFGDRDSVIGLLEQEQEKHVEKKKYLCSQHISLWKGDFADTLKDAIKSGTVSPWLVSMAPMVSPVLWQEACDAYSKQLLENTKSDPIETASYLLASHKVEDAIDLLCTATLFREALAVAKCRLSRNDPVINKIISKWATYSIVNGSYEVAAQCFIALEQYEEAAKALFKRSDEKTLEFALELAEKSQNKDLKDAIVFRYNTFKNQNETSAKVDVVQSINTDDMKLIEASVDLNNGNGEINLKVEAED